MLSFLKRHSGFFLLLAGIAGLVFLNVTGPASVPEIAKNSSLTTASTTHLGGTIESTSSATTTGLTAATTAGFVFVDIHGAISHPDVYRVLAGTRIGEVIAMAGGATSGADLTSVNQAKIVVDEMIIFIPSRIQTNPMDESDPIPDRICVDVKGAVERPGMYYVAAGARVDDAIDAAGGMKTSADASGLNLAGRLTDGQIVFIPAVSLANPTTEIGWAPGYGYVAIKGEVLHPGLYYVKTTSTLEEVLLLAGGLTLKGSVGNLDLTEVIVPGSTVTVLTETAVYALLHPVTDPPTTPDPDPDPEEPVESGLVNINTARVEELDTLYGIGPVLAQNIIDYRAENGNFESIEDIMKVSGIKTSIYENIKDHIRV